ncbi:MAG: hypothetical protein ACKVOQ_22880 [Cyclobacteriaceae bacterium]
MKNYRNDGNKKSRTFYRYRSAMDSSPVKRGVNSKPTAIPIAIGRARICSG